MACLIPKIVSAQVVVGPGTSVKDYVILEIEGKGGLSLPRLSQSESCVQAEDSVVDNRAKS